MEGLPSLKGDLGEAEVRASVLKSLRRETRETFDFGDTVPAVDGGVPLILRPQRKCRVVARCPGLLSNIGPKSLPI